MKRLKNLVERSRALLYESHRAIIAVAVERLPKSRSKGADIMSAEDNKALYRRFMEEVFGKKNPGAIDQFIAPNCVDHAAPPGFPKGLEGAKQMLGMYLGAFPDVAVTIEDMVAEGDKVVARFAIRGTHQGSFMGIAATGKRVAFSGIDIVRVSGGKIVEHWESFDQLGLMQQLGAEKMPGQPGR